MSDTETLTLAISTAAFVVSAISLWRSSFAPFTLRIVNAPPVLAAQRISSTCDGQPAGWWIPTLDFGISFRNLGSRAGLVEDIRFICELRTESEQRSVTFQPEGMVDFSTYHQTRHDRFESIGQARKRDWYPILLGANEQAEFHMVFSTKSWSKPFAGELALQLEVCTKQGKWRTIRRYQVPFFEALFDGDTFASQEVA